MALWSQAHADLPAVVQSLQPKLGDLAKTALGIVASIGGALLLFLASFIIAGIIMAFGQSGARSIESIFDRIVGTGRGEEFAKLSTATIRAVALGVLGVAFIQAIVVGVVLMIAGVPFAGVLALIVLVLGIAQVPALLVTLPVIVYIWMSGDYGTGAAVIYTVLLFVAGMLDNVLKPLLLGRGVDAPMVVILLGALGGLATSGLLGMFVGATLLALGYQIFMRWVATNPDKAAAQRKSQAASLSRCVEHVHESGCERGRSGWQARCCSAPARRWGLTSSDLKCPPGWPAGRVARSSRWPLIREVHAAGRRRSGGAPSMIPCSTSWLPRRSA